MKRMVLAFVVVSVIEFLTGCVAVDQEWVHASKPDSNGYNYHRLVPGHIRWYQYERHHWNLGGKPQAFMGGIWYTITTPSDWFWYGPYELTPAEEFKKYNRKDCPSCKKSFEACIAKIKEYELQMNQSPEEKEKLREMINYIDKQNCLNGDFETPFEERFK